MSPEQLQTLRDKLIAACDAHISRGGKIVDRFFSRGVKQEYCCPTYALAGHINGGVDKVLSQATGCTISFEEAWSFIYAFDDTKDSLTYYRTNGLLSQEMVDLGTELRAKYITPLEGSQS